MRPSAVRQRDDPAGPLGAATSDNPTLTTRYSTAISIHCSLSPPAATANIPANTTCAATSSRLCGPTAPASRGTAHRWTNGPTAAPTRHAPTTLAMHAAPKVSDPCGIIGRTTSNPANAAAANPADTAAMHTRPRACGDHDSIP